MSHRPAPNICKTNISLKQEFSKYKKNSWNWTIRKQLNLNMVEYFIEVGSCERYIWVHFHKHKSSEAVNKTLSSHCTFVWMVKTQTQTILCTGENVKQWELSLIPSSKAKRNSCSGWQSGHLSWCYKANCTVQQPTLLVIYQSKLKTYDHRKKSVHKCLWP